MQVDAAEAMTTDCTIHYQDNLTSQWAVQRMALLMTTDCTIHCQDNSKCYPVRLLKRRIHTKT